MAKRQGEPSSPGYAIDAGCSPKATTPAVCWRSLYNSTGGVEGAIQNWVHSLDLAGSTQGLVVVQMMTGVVKIDATNPHIGQMVRVIGDTSIPHMDHLLLEHTSNQRVKHVSGRDLIPLHTHTHTHIQTYTYTHNLSHIKHWPITLLVTRG